MEDNSIDDQSSMEDQLEESWFFGNLLISPKKSNFITRCYSDPSPLSSNIINTSTSTNNINNNNNNSSASEKEQSNSILVRAPSLPMNFGREIEIEEQVVAQSRSKQKKQVKMEKKISCDNTNNNSNNNKNSNISKNRNNKILSRTKTMPSSMRNIDCQEEEIETVKMLQGDILPPRHNKGNPRYRPPRCTDMEGNIVNSDGSREMRRRYLNAKTLRRSTSELEIEEVQGFKDLGFTFDNKDLLSPSVVNILPGLQDKSLDDTDLQNKVQRPYLSEAWLTQIQSPSFVRIPSPNWALTRSSSDEMKAQIKFWARSVASNVHLEC